MVNKQRLWQAMAVLAGLGAGAAARAALRKIWTVTEGSDPPDNTAGRNTTWSTALIWALASGAALSVARLIAQRGAARAWEAATGENPLTRHAEPPRDPTNRVTRPTEQLRRPAGRARVGCSGWNYPHWRRAVYPADLVTRRWFEWYAALLDTVELNTTFYRLPTVATAESWAEQAPGGFVYAVKLGQYGSHRKKLSDAKQWLGNHLSRLDALGQSAGPTLVQLPPHWHRNTGRLDQFLTAWPDHRRIAVELRHPSWLHPDTYAVLADHGAALCVHDLFDPHAFQNLRLTTDWTYLRFHGPDAANHPYQSRYTGRRLHPVAERLRELLDDGLDVHAYFNNDQAGFAFADATWLAHRLHADAEQGAGPGPSVGP